MRRVHNKFSGMQDLSFFRDDNRDLKTSVGSGNFNYQREQGFRVSMGLGCEIGINAGRSGLKPRYESMKTRQMRLQHSDKRSGDVYSSSFTKGRRYS